MCICYPRKQTGRCTLRRHLVSDGHCWRCRTGKEVVYSPRAIRPQVYGALACVRSRSYRPCFRAPGLAHVSSAGERFGDVADAPRLRPFWTSPITAFLSLSFSLPIQFMRLAIHWWAPRLVIGVRQTIRILRVIGTISKQEVYKSTESLWSQSLY
jgi:hypothetical protein